VTSTFGSSSYILYFIIQRHQSNKSYNLICWSKPTSNCSISAKKYKKSK
jgi:hypothetical protein